jgi:dipeptidase E
MTKAIVAIGGGGSLKTRATAAIDREIIRLSRKKHPRLLLIPTATSDDQEYCQRIQKYFGGYWKCRVSFLQLIKQRPTKQAIKRAILSADIIYVGGGNTLKMMRLWRRLGVDRLLKSAYEKGIVLCGISAGSICWFDSGHSDSLSYYNPRKWKYINVRGLGLAKGVHCPHYDSQTLNVPRRRHFREMIGKIGGIGIAMENNCAVEFIDGKFYRVITSKRHAGAYKVYRKGGKVLAKKIAMEKQLTPIRKLYETPS